MTEPLAPLVVAWNRWRLRNEKRPADGWPLSKAEAALLCMAETAWLDKDGTARAAPRAWAAEQMAALPYEGRLRWWRRH